jgi:hypothetical protein
MLVYLLTPVKTTFGFGGFIVNWSMAPSEASVLERTSSSPKIKFLLFIFLLLVSLFAFVVPDPKRRTRVNQDSQDSASYHKSDCWFPSPIYKLICCSEKTKNQTAIAYQNCLRC